MELEVIESIASLVKSTLDEQQQKLLLTLEFSPTALRLAVAHANYRNLKHNCSGSKFQISDYLREYANRRQKLSDLNFQTEEAKVVYLTLQLTCDEILKMENGSKVIEVMNIISYTAPNDIPRKMFSSISHDEPELESLVNTLQRFSIVNFDEKLQVLSVDNLVQQAINRNHGTGEKERILEKALESLKMKGVNLSNIHHAVSIWNHADEYDCLVKKFNSLACEIICTYHSDSNHCPESVKFEHKARQALKRTLDPSHSGNLKLEYYLARFRFENDENLQRIVMRRPEAIIPYLDFQSSMSRRLAIQSEYSISLEIFRHVLEKSNEILGPNHIQTSLAKADAALATYKIDPSSLDETLDGMLEVVGELVRSKVKPDNEDLLLIQEATGNLYFQKGELDKALKILKGVHNVRMKILGKDNPETIGTLKKIADVWYEKLDFKRALEIYREVHESQEKAFGHEDSEVKDTILKITSIKAINTAIEYDKESNTLSALRALRKMLIFFCIATKSPAMKMAAQMYARITREMRNNLKIHGKDAISDDSLIDKVNCLKMRDDEAMRLFQSEEYKRSLTMLEEVLQEKKELLGSDHPLVLDELGMIAFNLYKLNEHEKSLNLYREIIDKSKKVLGPDHIDTLSLQYRTACKLYNFEMYEEALVLLGQVCNAREKVLGPNDPETLDALWLKGKTLSKQDRFIEAVDILREVFYKRDNRLGSDHPDTLVSQMSLADALSMNKEYFEAFLIYNQVNERQRIVNGDKDPLTLHTTRMIEKLLPSFLAIVSMEAEKIADIDGLNKIKGLHPVVSSGNVEAVKTMLSKGADITQVTSGKGNTSLHIATLGGNKEIVDILLEHAKKQFHNDPRKLSDFVNAQTTYGKKTSLHVAGEKGHLTIAKSLLKHGAIYNLKSKEGNLPVELAKDNGVSNLLKLVGELFEKTQDGKRGVLGKLNGLKSDELSAVVNARSNKGHTLVQVAADKQHKDIASGILRIAREKLK